MTKSSKRDHNVKSDEKQESESVMFLLSLAGCVTFGYLYATVGILIIDCQIDRTTWGKRTYPLGWWLVPAIAVILFLCTYFLFRRCTGPYTRLAAAAGPLAASYVMSLPIFRPEIPHSGLVWIGTVWVALIASWVLIRYCVFQPGTGSLGSCDKAALLEHTKEQLELSRVLLIGILGAYLALVISSQDMKHKNNREITKDAKSAVLLDGKFATDLAVISLMLLFGPILELVKRRRCLLDVFLTIPPSKGGLPKETSSA